MAVRDVVMAAAGQGDEAIYVDDVFSTYLYTGNSWYNNVYNSVALADGFNLIPGQELAGGYFAGFISTTANGVATHALIVAPRSGGDSISGIAWGTSGTVTGVNSVIDGPSNTATLANTYSSAPALFCQNLTLNGYSDWYLPASFELEIAYSVFKPKVSSNSAGSGANAYAVPPRTNGYTATAPAQTTVQSFVEAGSNYFTTQEYWTSTESNANEARIINFNDGNPNDNSKTSARFVRAFRRIAVSDSALDPYRVTGEGGLVWLKNRTAANHNYLFDTNRGVGKSLYSNLTLAQQSSATTLTAFNGSGFAIGSETDINTSGNNYASWTFRKAEKFFDVVTWTGDGAEPRNISHSLGSVPGCMFIKQTNSSTNWLVYHRTQGATKAANLNSTDFFDTWTGAGSYLYGTEPTSSVFTVGTGANASGATYVAYLFAHDAGGFGESGNDNVISCGSYTGAYPSDVTVNVGFEPQYLLVKNATQSSDWGIFDVMRGMPVGACNTLAANSSAAENGVIGKAEAFEATATGFIVNSGLTLANVNGATHIYIAIRRPNKPPTSGTEVFAPVTYTGNGTTQIISTGFANDAQILRRRASTEFTVAQDKLRGPEVLYTNAAAASVATTGDVTGYLNTGFILGASTAGSTNDNGSGYISWNFRRAPGFFDVVCYTGNGAAGRAIPHNLRATPQLVIFKGRTDASSPGNMFWPVFNTSIGNANFLRLDSNSAITGVGLEWWTDNGTTRRSPDASNLYIGTATQVNASGDRFVAYLFASLPGISKVGSYTGNGSSQTIDCGFTAGARFFLVKATSTTGSWWVYDSARGIVAAADPALQLNSTAAEVTSADAVDPTATGIIVNQEATCSINASGVSYIFLAIA